MPEGKAGEEAVAEESEGLKDLVSAQPKLDSGGL